MTQPGAINNAVPAGEGWLGQRLVDIERRLSGQGTARALEAASIGKGGLTVKDDGKITVNPGGTSITLRRDTITDTFGRTYPEARVTFDTSPESGEASLSLVDTGPNSLLVMESNPGAALTDPTTPDSRYRGSVYVSGNGGAALQHDTPTDQARAELYASGAGAVFTISANGLTAQINGSGLAINGPGRQYELDSSGIVAGPLALRIVSGEWQAINWNSGAFVPVRAASFPVGSSREVKDIQGEVTFDSLEAIKAAPAKVWTYRPDYADDPLPHVSPIAEDLPAELVHDAAGVASVDLLSLIGTLWDAVGKLTARVEALEAGATP